MNTLPIRTAIAAAALGVCLIGSAAAQRFDTVQQSSDVALNSFEKVYIAPVKIDLSADQTGENGQIRARANSRNRRKDADISERDQQENVEEFQKDLAAAFGKSFALVDAPGEGILTVDATITRLASNRPTSNDLGRSVGLSLSSVSAGGASYAVTLKEGDTDLVQITERDQSSLTDQVPRVAVWQDAQKSFTRFSRNLTRYVSRN